MIQIFQMRSMHPSSSKHCRTTEDQSWRFEKRMSLLDPGTHFIESTLICKMIFPDLQVWPTAILQLFELQGCIVPHLKDVIFIYLDLVFSVPRTGKNWHPIFSPKTRYGVCRSSFDVCLIQIGLPPWISQKSEIFSPRTRYGVYMADIFYNTGHLFH